MTAKISDLTRTLPPPDENAVKQSRELQRVIEKILTQRQALLSDVSTDAATIAGAMTLGEFVHQALYAPGLGYYASGTRKFGEHGDFVTAPELGDVFARCLARGAQRLLSRLNNPVIVEIGAGSGLLAYDLLLALEQLEALPDRYAILEVSADLQARQKKLLATLPTAIRQRISWLEQPPVQNFDGLILANEVIDALPFERFRVIETDADNPPGVSMDFVTADEGSLQLNTGAATTTVSEAVSRLRHKTGSWPTPYAGEIRVGLHHWLASVSQALQTGAMIFIDYGTDAKELYRADRPQGTLLCHYRHRAHDQVLLWPGLQDITAWVDFTALADAGMALGWTLDGYTTQAHFLMDCALDEVVTEAYASADTRQQLNIASQVKRLTMPGEMGERFKVMAFRRGLDQGVFSAACTGFEHHL